jgi:CheY-like chemotaxis protein
MGYAEMALNEVNPGEKLHRQLEQILEAAHRSADLTRQLLAFARKQTVNPKVLDLNDTIESMLKMLRRLIGEDINLGWNPGGNLWKLKIDPSQVDQVLANLAVNARDAISAAGSVTLKTENAVLDDLYCADHPGCIPGEYVLLKMIDTGSGMSEEVLKHIFEPFFTTKGMERGTGLGLSTVYGIVKQNNGFVEVNSELGKGTTFKIYLPRCEEEITESIKETEETPEGTETILLVEDDEPVLYLSKAILESLGYTVLAARTPEQAIRLIKTHDKDIHLLITDVVMPEMNGRELLERIAAIKPGLKCLYISGYTADVITQQGVLFEGIHFIQKPFKRSEIANKVREVLNAQPSL